MDTTLKKRTITQKNYNTDFLFDWDLEPPRSTLKLFHAKTDLKEAQRNLIVKHIDVQRSRIYSLREWQQVKADKSELREQIQAKNKTICDNRASTYRFNQKIKEFISAQTLVKDEIDQTELEVKHCSETKGKMEKYVSQYSELFTSYLQTVIEKCPEFISVQDILNKYEMLKNCRYDCAQLLEKEMHEALELKSKLIDLVREKSFRLNILDNTLAMLEIRKNKATEERWKWNQVVTQLDQEIAKRAEESVTLQEGCYNLYWVVCYKRNKKPTLTKEDTKNQMKYIEKTILFYKEVINLAVTLQQYQKQKKQENSHSKCNLMKSYLKDVEKQPIGKIQNNSSRK